MCSKSAQRLHKVKDRYLRIREVFLHDGAGLLGHRKFKYNAGALFDYLRRESVEGEVGRDVDIIDGYCLLLHVIFLSNPFSCYQLRKTKPAYSGL